MTSPEVALELAARRLEGETLARVVYLDPWRGDAPVRDRRIQTADRDAVGSAVILVMATGRAFEVRWADELGLRHGYGIAIREVPRIDPDLGVIEDVSAGRWRDLIGQSIVTASMRWHDIHDDLRSSIGIMVAICADHMTRTDYPRALELEFSAGRRVSIHAARSGPDGALTPFVNDLAVVFAT